MCCEKLKCSSASLCRTLSIICRNVPLVHFVYLERKGPSDSCVLVTSEADNLELVYSSCSLKQTIAFVNVSEIRTVINQV